MVAAGRGSIVNIGSLYASIAPEPRFYDHLPGDPPFLKPAAYGASKAAVLNLTRYFARLWGPHGVRVNAISPGGVEGGQDEQFLAKYTRARPARAAGAGGRPRRPAGLPGLGRVAVRDRATSASRRRVHGMSAGTTTRTIGNVIGGEERPAASGETIPKYAPATGELLTHVARSGTADVDAAIDRRGQPRSPPGRARRPPTAARCCAGSPSCSSATPTRSPRSSPPRPASRPRTRSARSAARSRWATSWPARAAACTARPRRPRCPNRQAMIVRQPLGVAGPDHRRQHADRQRRLEGLPGARVRQRGRC